MTTQTREAGHCLCSSQIKPGNITTAWTSAYKLALPGHRRVQSFPESRKVSDQLRLRLRPTIAFVLFCFVLTSSIPLLAQKASAPAVTLSTTAKEQDRFASLDALLKDAVEKGR